MTAKKGITRPSGPNGLMGGVRCLAIERLRGRYSLRTQGNTPQRPLPVLAEEVLLAQGNHRSLGGGDQPVYNVLVLRLVCSALYGGNTCGDLPRITSG